MNDCHKNFSLCPRVCYLGVLGLKGPHLLVRIRTRMHTLWLSFVPLRPVAGGKRPSTAHRTKGENLKAVRVVFCDTSHGVPRRRQSEGF